MLTFFALVAMAADSTPDPPPVRNAVPDPPAVVSALRIVPPGHHAHQRTDGTIIIHSDSNHGNADAHRGVPWPWPKTAFPGQRVP